jgi:hypothetical protein
MRRYIFLGVLFLVLFAAGIGIAKLIGQKGTWVCQNGVWVKQGNPRTSIPTSPCPGSYVGISPEPQAVGGKVETINITSPKANETIGEVLTITGSAKSSNNKLSWRIRNSDNSLLIEGLADVDATNSFKIITSYPKPKSTSGTIEVFSYDTGGKEENYSKVPIKFSL